MVVGIDEVGRGCLAGPVVAGAVALSKPIRGLKDSKQLTARQREKLDTIIRIKATACGIGWASADEVDRFGLTAAVSLAMRRALAGVLAACEGAANSPADEIIIDGNYNFLAEDGRARTVIGGDSLVPAVSAASIIAKVARDAYMRGLALDFPQYGFETHVGYGTPRHLLALQRHGACALHRRSFAPVAAVLARTAAQA